MMEKQGLSMASIVPSAMLKRECLLTSTSSCGLLRKSTISTCILSTGGSTNPTSSTLSSLRRTSESRFALKATWPKYTLKISRPGSVRSATSRIPTISISSWKPYRDITSFTSIPTISESKKTRFVWIMTAISRSG
jgi:hypothetical protein